MDFEPKINLCPCESGLEYNYCCGITYQNLLNILGKISDNDDVNDNLPTGLKASISTIELTPDLYPIALNLARNHAQYVKMSPPWYSESIFLDPGRILGTCAIESSAQWLLKNTHNLLPRTSPLIFHTAFSGSTLMSKALDLTFNCLPIREPQTLDSLCVYWHSTAINLEKELWFNRILNLLARRYDENKPAVIKASDCSNGLLTAVLLKRQDIPVLFIYTPLADFFSSCVKAEIRRTWIREHYLGIVDLIPEVIPTFKRHDINENSTGHLSAAFWSYNIAIFHQGLDTNSSKLRSLNFNDMLGSPHDTVAACAKWFELEPKNNINTIEEINRLFEVNAKDAIYKLNSKSRREYIIRILKENATELSIAESFARKLLGDKYPENNLPQNLDIKS